MYCCWFNRNRATFWCSLFSPNQIINLIKRDVQVRIFGSDLDTKENFWSFKNALCSINSDEDLSFFPALFYAISLNYQLTLNLLIFKPLQAAAYSWLLWPVRCSRRL